jgi:cyclic pyranopterin phosphate synthase
MLIDRFGRHIHYLRLSITDRCDLRCSYCLPQQGAEFLEPEAWLRPDEVLHLSRLLVAQGISHIRLTGGEPLTRKGVLDIAQGLGSLSGLQELSLSTNATRLAESAPALRAAGVDRVNISLDSLQRQRFAAITGRDSLPQVLAGLQAAKAAGLTPIKLNMVVQAGVNDDEADAMLAFALEQGFTLRLIEVMPLGSTGRQAGRVDVTQLAARLAQQFGLQVDTGLHGPGPARYWRSADGRCSLGAITPMSQHFCASCNRVRLAVDGQLHLCLGDEAQVPLGRMLRAGASDAELMAALHAGLQAKPERHDFLAQPEKILRFMASTGG